MSKQQTAIDWLEKELKEAIESQNYEYCTQLKIELNGLQKNVYGNGK